VATAAVIGLAGTGLVYSAGLATPDVDEALGAGRWALSLATSAFAACALAYVAVCLAAVIGFWWRRAPRAAREKASDTAASPWNPTWEAWTARHRRWLLLGITAVALVLRLWAVDRVPPGPDADEVSIGYNAYSIALTGRDEYGARLPAIFRAFGEFKRPAYVYADVPFVTTLGPTPLAVRLPSVLAGALAVPALYVVAVLLLRSQLVALAATGLLAVSPWHLQLSRAAREVNLLVLAVLLFAAAFLKAVEAVQRPGQPRHAGGAVDRSAAPDSGQHVAGWYCVAAALAFVLAIYSYAAALIAAPLLAFVLVRAYWSGVRRLPRRWLGAAAALAAAGCVPVGLALTSGDATVRFQQTSVLSDPDTVSLAAGRTARDVRDGAPWLWQVPAVVAARRAVDTYLAHFDPTFLFTRGDGEWRHHAGDAGQMYLWDAPAVVLGAAAIVRGRRSPPLQAIGGWLLVGPIPAAVAVDAPHALRSAVMLPALYLVAAAGAPALWRWLRGHAFCRDWVLLLALSVGYYLYAYYRYYPVEHDAAWSSGALEAFRAAQAEVAAGNATQIVVPYEIDTAYVYALFASRYDPHVYLASGGTSQRRPRTNDLPPGPLRFGPWEIRDVQWSQEPPDPRTLYLVCCGRPGPPNGRVLQEIAGPSGRDPYRLIVPR
jgi:4-amino-4-deoxy-L-arabinose transferase-like glycosyltransferase